MEQPVVSSGPSSVTAVVTFSKGFACACGQSVVHLFEKSDEKDYRKTREIQVCAVMLLVPNYWSFAILLKKDFCLVPLLFKTDSHLMASFSGQPG